MLDLGTQTLLSIALLLALNNAIIRVSWMRTRSALFYAVQVLNAAVASWLFTRGIRGFEDMPAISWMLGLLLILHIVQNIRWKRANRVESSKDEERELRASAIRDALKEEPDVSDD